jgi:hypothetical protein
MKIQILLFLGILLLNSCTYTAERPATVIGTGTIVIPGGPAYTAPPCNITLNNTTSSLLNFQLKFTSTPIVSISNGTLTYDIQNANFDKMRITLSPFVPEQSTLYSIRSSVADVKNYEAHIEFDANSLSPTKLQANSQVPPNSMLYLKYNAVSKIYQMDFCNVNFEYYFNFNTYQQEISGKFNFKL